MEETKIKSVDFIEQAKELKSKRQMMGIKAVDFSKIVNMHQANYSKIENGLADPSKCMPIIRKMFNEFKKERIEALKNQIKLLEKTI